MDCTWESFLRACDQEPLFSALAHGTVFYGPSKNHFGSQNSKFFGCGGKGYQGGYQETATREIMSRERVLRKGGRGGFAGASGRRTATHAYMMQCC